MVLRVWVDGVEGAELGEGPVVFAVPELLAGPDDDPGCFRFLPFWPLELAFYNHKKLEIRFLNQTLFKTHLKDSSSGAWGLHFQISLRTTCSVS